VTRAIDEKGHEINYYGIIQHILEFNFVGDKELKVVFFVYNWLKSNTMLNYRAMMISFLHIKSNMCII
jgi:hypothetical protein